MSASYETIIVIRADLMKFNYDHILSNYIRFDKKCDLKAISTIDIMNSLNIPRFYNDQIYNISVSFKDHINGTRNVKNDNNYLSNYPYYMGKTAKNIYGYPEVLNVLNSKNKILICNKNEVLSNFFKDFPHTNTIYIDLYKMNTGNDHQTCSYIRSLLYIIRALFSTLSFQNFKLLINNITNIETLLNKSLLRKFILEHGFQDAFIQNFIYNNPNYTVNSHCNKNYINISDYIIYLLNEKNDDDFYSYSINHLSFWMLKSTIANYALIEKLWHGTNYDLNYNYSNDKTYVYLCDKLIRIMNDTSYNLNADIQNLHNNEKQIKGTDIYAQSQSIYYQREREFSQYVYNHKNEFTSAFPYVKNFDLTIFRDEKYTKNYYDACAVQAMFMNDLDRTNPVLLKIILKSEFSTDDIRNYMLKDNALENLFNDFKIFRINYVCKQKDLVHEFLMNIFIMGLFFSNDELDNIFKYLFEQVEVVDFYTINHLRDNLRKYYDSLEQIFSKNKHHLQIEVINTFEFKEEIVNDTPFEKFIKSIVSNYCYVQAIPDYEMYVEMLNDAKNDEFGDNINFNDNNYMTCLDYIIANKDSLLFVNPFSK